MPKAEEAAVPLVNVLPMRIRLAGANASTVSDLQSDINEMQEFEGIPLGKIQNLVHKGQLFEVIFSIHFEEELEHRLWDLVDASSDLPLDVRPASAFWCFKQLSVYSASLPVRLLRTQRPIASQLRWHSGILTCEWE